MRTRARHRRAGFTLIEAMMVLALAAIVMAKIVMVLEEADEAQTMGMSEMALEDEAIRVMDQIAFAIMGSDRESLTPAPSAPTFSEELLYQLSLGVDEGAVVWGDPERIGLVQSELNRLTWTSNPGADGQKTVTWTNDVRPYREDELPNGTDDNANDLVDERGLSFSLEGSTVQIRVTLEKAGPEGATLLHSTQSSVTCRN